MKPFNSKYYKIYAALFLAAHLSFIAGGALHTHSYYHAAKSNQTSQNDPLSSSSSECIFHIAASSLLQMDHAYCGCDQILISGAYTNLYNNPFALLTVEYSPFSFRAPPCASC